MKKFLSLALLIVLTLTLLITGCQGRKAVQSIELNGLKREYEIGETPDYTGVTGKIIYNDGTTEDVDHTSLTFGNLDTSTPGKKDLEVTFKNFTAKFTVTVKNASIDVGGRDIQSIEYFNGLPRSIYEGETINFNLINIIANYITSTGEETEETISVGANSNIKHNGADINTSVPGTYTLTLTYMGKSVNVPVVIKALEIVDLQVVAGSVDTTIYENQDFDPTGMIVKAVYNSGAEYQIPVDQLTITRNDNIITISYQGKSVSLALSYDTPFVTGITITNTGYENTNNTIVYGDILSTGSVRVKATYSNNTTQMLAAEEFTCSHDIDQVGEGTLTVTYNADTTITASATFTVLGINKIAIDTSSVSTLVKVNSNFSTADLKVIITCSDGSKVQRTITEGVTVNANVDTATKDTYYITASYGGVTSAELAILVYEEENYIITGISLPDSLAEFEANKSPFLNKGYTYVVGDDNPFIFRLKLQAIDGNAKPLDHNPSYTSYSEVYLDGNLLSGDDLAKYCVIDDIDNSFDFTEEAIGMTFTLKTRPRFVADNRDDATKEITVTVVDGLNIYEAWELNYITNYNDTDAPGMENRTQYVDAFLNEKGATRPETLAGIVLHNDLTVKREDVPKEYFVGENRNNDFFDYITVFAHATDSVNKTFTLHGNYYTIFSYDLPNVCAKGVANQTDYVSSGQLFRFTCNQTSTAGYNHSDYTTNIQNLYLKDDNPNKDSVATADRDMRGLIGMKVQWQVANIENVVIEAYYISFYVDCDDSTANVNECKFYNAYQNHIYAYNCNSIQGYYDAPHANYSPVTINVTNSEITKCGGPVILTQCEGPTLPRNAKSGPQVNIDANTDIWTWVTGTEAWFKATGTTAIAAQLQTLGLGLAQEKLPTIIRTTGETGESAGENIYFMNMVMVNIVNGTDVSEILTSAADLDGKLTIGDKTYLNMNDECPDPYGMGYGYGDANVTNAFLAGGGKNTIIHTCEGGMVVIDANNNFDPTQGNPAGLAAGDYVATYFGTFGFVFGYAPFQ